MDSMDSTRVANSLSAIEDCLIQMSRPCYLMRPTVSENRDGTWRVIAGDIEAQGATIALAMEHFDAMVRL